MMRQAIICLFLFLSVSGGILLGQVSPVQYYIPSENVELSKIFLDKGAVSYAEEIVLKSIQQDKDLAEEDKRILISASIDRVNDNHSNGEKVLTKFINKRNNSPLRARAALLRAYISMDAKEYTKAENFFYDAWKLCEEDYSIRKDENSRTMAHLALYWRGISKAVQGKYQEANPVFEECAKRYPDGIYADDALYALGQSAEINRHYEKAIQIFSKINQNYRFSNSYIASRIREANNRLVLRESSSALVALKHAEIAENHIIDKDSIGLLYEPQTYLKNAREDIQYLRGEAYNIAKKYQEALNNFNAFLETFYESDLKDYVRLGAGWSCLNLGDYQKAIEYYDVVIRDNINEESSKVRAIAKLYRTTALLKSGNENEAKIELEDMSLDPSYPFLGVVLLELGQISYREGEFTKARKYLERADREAIDALTTVRIHLLLAATYIEIDRWSKAINEYEKAEKLAEAADPIIMPQKEWYLAEARLKKGIALVNNHRSAEAVPSLVSFTANHPNDIRMDEAVFWLAEAYYRSEMFKNAIVNYNAVANKYRGSRRHEEALYGLGWSQYKLRQLNKSSATFAQLLREYPKTKYKVEVLSRQADAYYLSKVYRKAVKSYEQAAKLAPNTEDGQYAAFQLCDAYYRMGAYRDAMSAVMSFVRKYPKSPFAPNALYLKGWIQFEQNSYDDAIASMKYLIAAYPQSGLLVRAHYAVGDAMYNQGKYEEAIEVYKQIVEEYPNSGVAPEAMKSIQQCYEILGRDEEAQAVLDNYTMANPDSPFAPEFQFKKGDIFYTGRNYREAIDEFDRLLEKYPNSVKNEEAYFWKIKSYINLNESENALETYKKMKKLYPKGSYTANALLELGLMYTRTNDIAKADTTFINLQSEFPENEASAQAGYERAKIYFSMGDTTKFLNSLRNVAENYKKMEYADQSRWKIAMYYRSKGENDSARFEFKYLADSSMNVDVAAESQYRIAELLLRDKNYEMAAFEFVKFRDKYSVYEEWYHQTLMNLGECYENLENWEGAKEAYESLLALSPDTELGRTAKKRLRRIRNK